MCLSRWTPLLAYTVEYGGPARVRRLMSTIEAHIRRGATSFAELDALLGLLDDATEYLARVARADSPATLCARYLAAKDGGER